MFQKSLYENFDKPFSRLNTESLTSGETDLRAYADKLKERKGYGGNT